MYNVGKSCLAPHYQHRHQYHITAQKHGSTNNNAILTSLPVFSPSRDELRRAVDCCLGVSSDGNVSQVTDMSKLIYNIDTFDYDLSDWDVSRVTDMREIFFYAESFNQDLSNWDVSRVTSMKAMFSDAKSFNQDLSKWDVSLVVDMQFMFYDTSSFQQTLCGAAWVNSKALKEGMFHLSPGSISDTVCGTWML